jgi:uncharacterized membrane protein
MPQFDRTIPTTVMDNIETVIRIEEEEATRRRWSERISDMIASFVGSVGFVIIHLIVFFAWVVANTGILPVPAFDPYPFAFLTMFVSLEGVLLSTFVLIKQNRMSLRADRRSHLDLQINLLTEKEVTKLIQVVTLLAERLGAQAAVHDQELKELRETTAVDELARDLQRKLPEG